MKPLSLAIAVFIVLITTRASYCQDKDRIMADSLIKQFRFYKSKMQHGTLYAHFDKNVYTDNENVWFTAYLLNSQSAQNDILSAILVRDRDRAIMLTDKFSMSNGVAFGNIFLPDSLQSGNYTFLLYANTIIDHKPADVFIQPITLKNTSQVSLKASLALLDTEKFPKDSVRRVLLTVSTPEGKFVSGATVKYFTGYSSNPFSSGTVKTDKTGEFIFKVPARRMALGNNILHAQINYNKDRVNTEVLLPFSDNPLSVRFYPEGGNLSDGVRSVIGWEAKDAVGKPRRVEAVLYCNEKVLDTMSTDDYGMGRFSITPLPDNHYYVKLLPDHHDGVSYDLPNVVKNIPVIFINKAVASDTLKLVIRSNRHGKVHLIVHNYNECFAMTPIMADSGEKRVRIPLTDVPKGLAEITLLDSAFRPCAERLFFAHYDKRINVNINTGKQDYHKREKVNVKIKLSGPGESAIDLHGLVSIACVQENRLLIKKNIRIDNYFYLTHNVGELPEKESYLDNQIADKDFLENVLLIKGWRRYRWEDLTKTTATDTLIKSDTLNFTGAITYFGKPLKKPAMLVVRKDSAIGTIETDGRGRFLLKDEDLVTRSGKKIYLYVNGASTEDYGIAAYDPYESMSAPLAKTFIAADFENWNYGAQSEGDPLKGFEHAIHLKEVKITANNSEGSFYGMGANPCGDYVCKYNILNCSNHRADAGNKPARLGRTYKVYDSGVWRDIVYTGCSVPATPANVFKLTGITYPMDFYPVDYSELSPSEPEFLSTIYWKYLSKVSSEKELNFSFYTSDILGNFRIVVQGVTGNDVLYGEKTINVQK